MPATMIDELPETVLDVLAELAAALQDPKRTTAELEPLRRRLLFARAREAGTAMAERLRSATVTPVRPSRVTHVSVEDEMRSSDRAMVTVTYRDSVSFLDELAGDFPWAAEQFRSLRDTVMGLAPELRGAVVAEALHYVLDLLGKHLVKVKRARPRSSRTAQAGEAAAEERASSARYQSGLGRGRRTDSFTRTRNSLCMKFMIWTVDPHIHPGPAMSSSS